MINEFVMNVSFKTTGDVQGRTGGRGLYQQGHEDSWSTV